MADCKINGTQDVPQVDGYTGFATRIGHQLHLLRFRADAAQSLLQQHADTDSSDQLVGTSYLLEDIAKLANELAEQVDDSTFKFVLASGKRTASKAGSARLDEAPETSNQH